jgi:cellulose synthase/poly-beta-1,6-N-acetylglucosamine synthase-like glycosyltransferase
MTSCDKENFMSKGNAGTMINSTDSSASVTDRPLPQRQRPFVSVIIPHYNDLEALAVCIASLKRQTWPADRMEVIVADNNSSCGLAAVAAVAIGCHVVHAPIQGAGPARNTGAAIARGEILAFIDSDCDPCPVWIDYGVQALAAYDFAGGYVENTPRDPARPTAIEAWEMVFGFDFERYIHKEGYTGSGNMWVWRQVFDAVGGFRTGVSEDMDWSFRATAQGFRLGYEPKAAVTHFCRANWTDLLTRWRRVATEHFLLARERPAWLLRWTARTIGMPLSVAPHLIRIIQSKRLPTVRSRMEAAFVLVSLRLWRASFMLQLMFTSAPRGVDRAAGQSDAAAVLVARSE